MYIHLPVSPSFVFLDDFDVNVKESPFDANSNFDLSPVNESGRDHVTRRLLLGPIYVRSLHFARHLNSLQFVRS